MVTGCLYKVLAQLILKEFCILIYSPVNGREGIKTTSVSVVFISVARTSYNYETIFVCNPQKIRVLYSVVHQVLHLLENCN